MTMNARTVVSCGLHMSTSIPKGRRNGANVRVASFGFATLFDISAHERECCDKAAQDGGDDNSDSAEDDNGEE